MRSGHLRSTAAGAIGVLLKALMGAGSKNLRHAYA